MMSTDKGQKMSYDPEIMVCKKSKKKIHFVNCIVLGNKMCIVVLKT